MVRGGLQDCFLFSSHNQRMTLSNIYAHCLSLPMHRSATPYPFAAADEMSMTGVTYIISIYIINMCVYVPMYICVYIYIYTRIEVYIRGYM